MVRYTKAITKESCIEIEGVVVVPNHAITTATQKVEIHVRKIHCINRAPLVIPFNLEDASRNEAQIEKDIKDGHQRVRVNQDTRLNNRFLDLRTPANNAIFHLKGKVKSFFMEFMRKEGFKEIQTPKIIAGTSEGGAAVFKLDYNGKPACLAQSPQLHKQMALCCGFERVFVVGPVFRAENHDTHRHLSEFTGIDVEMKIKEDYFEVMDVVGRLFVELFDKINERCGSELEAINNQYPFKPLKYRKDTLKLTFEEGIQMLKDDGKVKVDPLKDLDTKAEKRLGELVSEQYGTDLFILYRYPLAVRPFYTMPCPDNEDYSNSFDVFIRGEEIISGAQREHVPELLESRATECGIDLKTISNYLDSFRYGAPPKHGGFGVGFERVVMLFCALGNIRKTSMFPRDIGRLAP